VAVAVTEQTALRAGRVVGEREEPITLVADQPERLEQQTREAVAVVAVA
jgi:hypothetical protein